MEETTMEEMTMEGMTVGGGDLAPGRSFRQMKRALNQLKREKKARLRELKRWRGGRLPDEEVVRLRVTMRDLVRKLEEGM